MIDFRVDLEKCIGCGLCAVDCPIRIIDMHDRLPVLVPQKEDFCIGCLHCFAVCSEGAVSILGHSPEEEIELTKDILPSPDQMETLIRGRRSVRSYRDENMSTELVDELLDMAWQAPTGRNNRDTVFHVVDDKDVLAEIREELLSGIEKLVESDSLDEAYGGYAKFPSVWKDYEYDALFRGAPHLIVTSSPSEVPTPMQDAVIALTTLEMYAQSKGIGTVWNGLARGAIVELVPSIRKRLNIPEDHEIGYVMGFGLPALRYFRTVNRGKATVQRIK